MLDCTYFLYKALLKQFPYVLTDEAEYADKQLKKVEARLNRTGKLKKNDLLRLIDSTDLLANERARYAFSWAWTPACPSPGRGGSYRANGNAALNRPNQVAQKTFQPLQRLRQIVQRRGVARPDVALAAGAEGGAGDHRHLLLR